jgi:uncharacterized protein (TIGR00725 family)
LTRPLRFTVVGGSRCDEATASLAERIGSAIARRGGVLICGGLGGVMEAASRGAAVAGGLTVGILPGTDPSTANEFIQLPIPTGMGDARNIVNVLSADAVIAVKGSYGTMNEIAEALGVGIPVVAVDYWDDIDDVEQAADAEDAVGKAFAHAEAGRS